MEGECCRGSCFGWVRLGDDIDKEVVHDRNFTDTLCTFYGREWWRQRNWPWQWKIQVLILGQLKDDHETLPLILSRVLVRGFYHTFIPVMHWLPLSCSTSQLATMATLLSADFCWLPPNQVRTSLFFFPLHYLLLLLWLRLPSGHTVSWWTFIDAISSALPSSVVSLWEKKGLHILL